MNIILIVLISFILFLFMLWGLARLVKLAANILFIGVTGAVVGVIIGALVAYPLTKLPGDFGVWLPIVIMILVVIGSITLFLAKKESITSFFALIGRIIPKPQISHKESTHQNEVLLDTSAIIDGRVLDIAKTGFIPGKLLVPRFILMELQNIADSSDDMKRKRGRRGLELLDEIKHNGKVKVEVIDEDFPKIKEVDSKLVHLAKKHETDILTTDYNLNKVAKFQGVRVLNINELSNAIKPVVLPGEELKVKIVQPGKERGQGVGYMPDGTMIVVEGGDKMIGEELICEVKRIFQTVAGKMIFVIPLKNKGK